MEVMNHKRIAVIGTPGSGKSALITRLKTGKFSPQWIKTWGISETTVVLNNESVNFVEYATDLWGDIVIGPEWLFDGSLNMVIICIHQLERKRYPRKAILDSQFKGVPVKIIYPRGDRLSSDSDDANTISSKTGFGITELIRSIISC